MDDSTRKYADDVLAGKINVCKWVRLACERHIRDLERDDIWFDVAAAERFFKFCTYLQHYNEPYIGKPIILEPWQRFIFGNIYGWKRIIDGEKTQIWRFHYAFIEVPRKNGKTTMSAAAALYDCGLINDSGASVYCLATKEDQAKYLWNDCAAFIKRSEDLQEEFNIVGKRIYATPSGRTSFIQPLGRDSDTLDGLNPIAAYTDELHAWKNRDLWDVIQNAFGSRLNWHMISITTSGYFKEGICYKERKHGIEVLEKIIRSDDKFCIIYTVDDEDKEDWDNPEVWKKANPNLGTGKQFDYMEDQARKAGQIPSELNSFLNKQLNIWTDAAEAWLTYESWKVCGKEYGAENLKGKKCYAGMDLARVRDLSATAYVFPVQPGVDVVTVLVDFYISEEDMKQRSKRDRVPYDVWVKQKWITATPGNTTDFDFIKEDILKRCGEFDVLELAYDRHFAGEIVNSLQNEGVNLVEFGMGFVSMGAPTAELERLVIGNEIRHNNNPVLTWNAGNTVVRRDPADNIKPDKEKSQEKIDGIVAVIMAIGRMLIGDGGPVESVYETRGLRVL